MAHLIDQSTGRDAIAFVGQTPWHGLGKQLTSGADIETWRREAGLDYKVERTPVQFAIAGSDAINDFPDRDVLYRDDTRSPISVVSKWYNVVQPGEILGFFEKLTEHNGFTLETAGALDGGKRVWALARVNDGAPILDADVIRPYVLLATSYDATLSTTAKFTSVRVVCHNTLTMSAGYGGEGQSEKDSVGSCIRIPHSAKFDANGLFEGCAIGSDLPEAKGTAYGLLNAVTEYVDHQRGGDLTRLSSAWFGSGEGLKNEAFALLEKVTA